MDERRPQPFLFASLLAALLLVSACGGTDEGAARDERREGPASAVPAPGGAVTVSQALGSKSDDILLVAGSLVVEGDEARLCEALAESYPPQCGGASIAVDGLPAEEREKLMKIDDGRVEWSEGEVRLLGRVREGVLVVEPAAR